MKIKAKLSAQMFCNHVFNFILLANNKLHNFYAATLASNSSSMLSGFSSDHASTNRFLIARD